MTTYLFTLSTEGDWFSVNQFSANKLESIPNEKLPDYLAFDEHCKSHKKVLESLQTILKLSPTNRKTIQFFHQNHSSIKHHLGNPGSNIHECSLKKMIKFVKSFIPFTELNSVSDINERLKKNPPAIQIDFWATRVIQIGKYTEELDHFIHRINAIAQKEPLAYIGASGLNNKIQSYIELSQTELKIKSYFTQIIDWFRYHFSKNGFAKTHYYKVLSDRISKTLAASP